MSNKSFKRILRSMSKYKTSYFVGIIGLSTLQLLFQVAMSFLFLDLFDTLSNGSFRDVINAILPYITIMIGLMLGYPIFSYLSRISIIKTTVQLRKEVFDKLTKLPLDYYKRRHSAETISILTNDITETERAYSEHMLQFLVSVIGGIGSTIAMLMIDWRIALIPIMMGILTYFLNSHYSRILRAIGTEVQQNMAKLNTKLSDLIAGIHVIRIFNIQRQVLEKFKRCNENTHAISIERVNRLASINTVNDFIYTISFAGIGLFGAYLVLEGLTTVGVIVAIIHLQNGITQLVKVLGNFIANLQYSLAAASRVYALLDEPDESSKINYKAPSLADDEMIKIKDLSFGYESKKLVLSDLNLTIKRNQTVAIVGPSGGGKSTLFKMLLQFYPPTKGEIGIDDENTHHNKIPSIRKCFAYVPQDAYLFHASVYENIAYGNPEATKEMVIDAAKKAHAHGFIMSLEKGYETLVKEQGANLSGGQRQRIAIARAIVKNAPIYLLDEATSALDNESEKLVQQTLESLMDSATSLVIAHRLSTIEQSDLIVVIDQGKIIESGNQKDLIRLENGLYKSLYESQLSSSQS